MLFQFANVLVFILFSFLFIFALLAISKLLTPRHHDADKLISYECGERPSGSGRLQFNIRFYLIALAFLIFDVEIAFMFPVGMIMRSFVDSGQGWFVLVEVLLFILILFLGLVYLWRKGDLDWVKDLQVSRGDTPIELRRHSQSRPE
jgi:NADH-quinone oxidoreductase subunit A